MLRSRSSLFGWSRYYSKRRLQANKIKSFNDLKLFYLCFPNVENLLSDKLSNKFILHFNRIKQVLITGSKRRNFFYRTRGMLISSPKVPFTCWNHIYRALFYLGGQGLRGPPEPVLPLPMGGRFSQSGRTIWCPRSGCRFAMASSATHSGRHHFEISTGGGGGAGGIW